MMLVNSFILVGALTFGQPVGEMLPDQDAPRYIAKAVYKQYSLDKVVNRIEKRYLPKPVKKYGGYIGIGIRLATEKRFTYTWKF